jgi:hypothetical protein
VKRLLPLILLFSIGCHNGIGGSGGSSAASATAASVQANDVLSRLPAPVATAFQKNHPNQTASIIHVRLFPDGSTHYQIIYTDSSGQPQQANYYGDGRAIP